MNFKYLLITLSVFNAYKNVLATQTVLYTDDEEDFGYYWRNYDADGIIPRDAVPGGKSLTTGVITYIGQVLHKEQLIPAKIEVVPKIVTYEWGYKEFIATKNIKILCSSNPSNFQWLTTKFNTFLNDVKNKNLVPGGYEENADLYIGRKEIDGELVVGKIISTKLQTTLNTTKNGKGIQHSEFSVLVYNPNGKTDIDIPKGKPDKPTNPVIDVDVRSGMSESCNNKVITMNIFNIVTN